MRYSTRKGEVEKAFAYYQGMTAEDLLRRIAKDRWQEYELLLDGLAVVNNSSPIERLQVSSPNVVFEMRRIEDDAPV